MSDIRTQWEGAAPGWARWETTVTTWMEPATLAMLDMAKITAGNRVLDLASGAGSQALLAAQRVGVNGSVVASDISTKMLHYVSENAQLTGLTNVTTLAGAAEELEWPENSFDAVICRLGLMLFSDPVKVLQLTRRALRPGGRVAAVVFTTPVENPFMAKPMQILLRHAGKMPPAEGRPGIFALGAPGKLERLLTETGFINLDTQPISVTLRLPSADKALTLMQEAFGAYRAVVSDCAEDVRQAAWSEVMETLKIFETSTEFAALTEVLVAAGTKPR